MWVKSESGQLLNMAHARTIEVFPSREKFVVVAHFVGNESGDDSAIGSSLFVPLCADKSEPDAHELLERIGRALDGKDAYLDLNRLS